MILLDIEGTTTPVEFVYRTLFGFARENFSTFLHAASDEPEVRDCIADLKAQCAADRSERKDPPEWRTGAAELEIDSAARYALWLMDRDSKTRPLKSLQGLIWQEGYRSGKLHGEIYPDVLPAFERWRKQGKEISIYSSGSALAQEMLFRTIPAVDLTTRIKAFFDTRVGNKTNPESYKKIASISGFQENRILFLSDTVAELDAALSAGMRTALVVRSSKEENDALSGHPIIKNFDELA